MVPPMQPQRLAARVDGHGVGVLADEPEPLEKCRVRGCEVRGEVELPIGRVHDELADPPDGRARTFDVAGDVAHHTTGGCHRESGQVSPRPHVLRETLRFVDRAGDGRGVAVAAVEQARDTEDIVRRHRSHLERGLAVLPDLDTVVGKG